MLHKFIGMLVCESMEAALGMVDRYSLGADMKY